MKKAWKIFRSVFTLALVVTLASGIFGMNASAETRAACSHPQQRIIVGERVATPTHYVLTSSGMQLCHITQVYATQIKICATCGYVVSETDTSLISETHSISH